MPKSAVRREGDQDVVFVVHDDKVERRAVKVGGAEGDRVRVLSGVAANETVVVAGPELVDGDAVKVKPEAK